MTPLRVFLALVLGATGSIYAQPYGIDSREENTDLLITELPPDGPGSMQLERVFPSLGFPKSVLLTESPDDSGRLFVVSQRGRIRVFPRKADPQPSEVDVFLDISERVLDSGERGLLGMAFSPDYATSGEFYVSYVTPGGSSGVGVSRISRFTNSDPASNTVDGSASNEEIILSLDQPFSNHNGGMIAFGPDEMLYFGLGDGGSGGDPLENGQDTTTLFGSILRIDVMSGPAPGDTYVIPPDNPFVGGGPAGSATREEIYAYGLRNPWRFSFDQQNGMLYAGDVGQNDWEEVDVIRPGENYGWDVMEGTHCFEPPSGCDQSGLTLPIAEYSHSTGVSITGGYVYYGSLAELYGVYIYADYGTGTIFGLTYDGVSVTQPVTLVGSAGFNIAGFGQDSTGEVYVLDIKTGNDGGIYVLRPPSGGGSSFPTRVSDLPALETAASGQGHTVGGVIPYEPSAKLWSDSAVKERYIAMPGLEQIGYRANTGWDFPEETILLKTFLLPLDRRDPENTLKRIETRLMYKKNSLWHGFTYEWDDQESDAQLLTTGKTRDFQVIDKDGQQVTQTWYYPTRAECMRCHSGASNRVLGLTTRQLNYDFTYPESGVTDNQLRTLDHISVFEQPLPDPPDQLPRMPDYEDTSASIQDRARAYLDSNCSMCHQPGGISRARMNLHWTASNEEMNAIGESPVNGELGLPNPQIIAPGDADRSVLLERMRRLDDNRMPPLARNQVDETGTEIIRQWIESLQMNNTEGWMMY